MSIFGGNTPPTRFERIIDRIMSLAFLGAVVFFAAFCWGAAIWAWHEVLTW